jgi:hypothetical protein
MDFRIPLMIENAWIPRPNSNGAWVWGWGDGMSWASGWHYSGMMAGDGNTFFPLSTLGGDYYNAPESSFYYSPTMEFYVTLTDSRNLDTDTDIIDAQARIELGISHVGGLGSLVWEAPFYDGVTTVLDGPGTYLISIDLWDGGAVRINGEATPWPVVVDYGLYTPPEDPEIPEIYAITTYFGAGRVATLAEQDAMWIDYDAIDGILRTFTLSAGVQPYWTGFNNTVELTQ